MATSDPTAVEQLTAALNANPLAAFEWLDQHLHAVVNEAIDKDLQETVPASLPATLRTEMEEALLFRMLMDAGLSIGSYGTGQGRNLLQAARFRALMSRFRSTSRYRALVAQAEAVLDRGYTLRRATEQVGENPL